MSPERSKKYHESDQRQNNLYQKHAGLAQVDYSLFSLQRTGQNMSSKAYGHYSPMQERGSEQLQLPVSGNFHHEVFTDPIYDIFNAHDAIMKGHIKVPENQYMMHSLQQ